MNIRFYHARILTMDGGCVLQEGELWTSGNRIAYIGPGKDAKDIVWDEQIDCQGNVLMPGFKNAHTHSGYSGSHNSIAKAPG